jgi:hypothetical protein
MMATREGELSMPPTHGRYDCSGIPSRLDHRRAAVTDAVVPR